jgi:hypothetical protein
MNGRGRLYKGAFGADQFSIQAMKSLHTKYTYDYLPYFEALEDIYDPDSPRAKDIRETIALINRMRDLLEEVVSSGQITSDNSKRLTSLAGKIQARKRFFAREAKKVDALHQSLQEASEKTGISLQELNATRERIKAGIQLSQEAAQEPRVPDVGVPEKFARRPRRWADRMLPSIGAVTLGPFYPVVEKLVKEEIRERRALGGWGFPEGTSAGREYLPELSGFPRGSRVRRTKSRFTVQEQAASLMWFFEEGAYKTKWTKELLAAVKGERPTGIGEGILGGLGTMLASLLPGVLGAAAGAIPVWLGEKAYAKWTEALAGEYEALDRQLDSLIMWTEYANQKRAELKRDIEGSMKVVSPIMGGIISREKGELQVPLEELGESPFVTPSLETMKRIKERSEVSVKSELAPSYGGVEPGVVSAATEFSAHLLPKPLPAELSLKDVSNLEQPLENLNKAVDNLADKIKENFAEGPRLPMVGNIYDSGDTLIQVLAAGMLTLRGW